MQKFYFSRAEYFRWNLSIPRTTYLRHHILKLFPHPWSASKVPYQQKTDKRVISMIYENILHCVFFLQCIFRRPVSGINMRVFMHCDTLTSLSQSEICCGLVCLGDRSTCLHWTSVVLFCFWVNAQPVYENLSITGCMWLALVHLASGPLLLSDSSLPLDLTST